MSTYELIVLTLKGDQDAARALVKILTPIFHHEARFAIWRIRGTPEDVKELINDIFADLFADGAAALRRYDPEKGASPEGYFRHFARLRCMSYARDERDRLLERLTAPSDLSELPDGANPESRHIQGLDAQSKLKRITEVLAPADFEIFKRRYLQHQETDEICSALGISRDVYFQRIHRMIARLQQHGLVEKEYRGRKSGKKDPPD